MFDTLIISHFVFDTESYEHFANNIIHSRPSGAHALIFAQVFDLLDSEHGSEFCDQPKKSKNSRKNIFLQNRSKMHRKRPKCKKDTFWKKNILVTRLSFFRQNSHFCCRKVHFWDLPPLSLYVQCEIWLMFCILFHAVYSPNQPCFDIRFTFCFMSLQTSRKCFTPPWSHSCQNRRGTRRS